MNKSLFKVRDKRDKGWFWMNNDYLNGWARYFGAIGTAIYVSLCRHADNTTQQCFPAQKQIAEELNIDERTVRRYLKKFEKCKLIKIEREKDNLTKKWFNNVYTLLDKDSWIKPEDITPSGKPEDIKDKSQRTKPSGHQTPINKTHINNTHNNKTHLATQGVASSINPLIELFKEVNPSYERLFSYKGQRMAIERMLKQFGREKLEKIINTLKVIQGEKYAPVITTPYELEQKMGQLIAFIRKKKNNQREIIGYEL